MNDKLTELTGQALSLPIAKRAELAQCLWESLQDVDPPKCDESEADALKQASQRDQELENKTAVGQPHKSVIEAARKAL